MTRVINLCLSAEEIETISEATSYDKLMAAIAYLSTWNVTGFRGVTINLGSSPNDLCAFYYDPDSSQRRYVIGAVWHDDHYGFHS
jgi:hypothetical protein